MNRRDLIKIGLGAPLAIAGCTNNISFNATCFRCDEMAKQLEEVLKYV